MKRIVNGKRYDTDTAELVAETSFSYPSDFNWCREQLYRTQKGAWFLHGEGGARTIYRTEVGQNSWSGGSRIDVLDEREALAWLERNQLVDEIESWFMVEDA